MKRDLQINYGVLDEIIEQLRKYQYNLETMEESLADVSTYIQTNKGKSMDAWEERITGSKEKIKDYQGQVGDLLSLFENYVADTTAYISPIARNAMMRVDRNDIWFNLKQMEGGIANNVPKALMKTYDSPTSIFNFLDNPTDAEKEASRINQKKIENIRKDIQQTKNSLAYKMDELWNLYTSKVKKFENVDDAYNDKAANVKSKYTNLFEGVWDVVEWGSEIVWGLIKGLAVGLYEIAKGLLTLVLDTGIVVLSDTIPDRIEPEGLKQIANDRVETYKQTMQQIISDPMSVVENIGQTVFDTAEDEGIMYVTGVGLTTFVPVVGQVGKGAKGVSTLKAISKGSNKNVPTEVFKGTPYSKDFIKQKVTITKTALGKQKVPVFYKEKLATDSVNITTFGMEMKPLSEVNPQMFSVKGAKSTGNLNRKEAFNNAKDLAGVPRSQQPTRQWQVGDNINKKGGDYKNYEYSSNPTHHGRYYEYDTPQGKRVIVEHINDGRLHTHAGKPKNGAKPFEYDFKRERYSNMYGPNGDHHIYYNR